MSTFFKVFYKSKKSKARLGEIKIAHGVIKTPSFVPVGTKGTVKSILPSLLEKIGVQVAFVNTYHLVTHPGGEIIKKAGGIHKYSGLNIPLMSDSGGFQVFSLAGKSQARRRVFSSTSPQSDRLQKQTPSLSQEINTLIEKQPTIVKISDDGVKFHSTFDGSIIEFTPEKSMEYQQMIGADINMAFDECIPYPSTYQYTKEATERTHRWLIRCIKKIQNSKFKSQNVSNFSQYLYGIIQGGVFEDLRRKSAQFVVSQSVDGVAIGGVSVGESKKEMREEVAWVSDYLPKDRPVHLLGVGQIDDIFDLVKYGVDTFDCVEPTRLARMGTIYQIQNLKFKSLPEMLSISKQAGQNDNEKFKIGEIDILKGKFRDDLTPVDGNCFCFVCQNFTKSYLHHLFKNKELLSYTLATYHNLWVMERFFENLKELISRDLI